MLCCCRGKPASAYTGGGEGMQDGAEVVAVTTEEDYDDVITDAPGLVVIDFYTTWCGPCRHLAPELRKMATQYRDVKFIKVDADDLQSVADREGVQALPTVVFYKSGKKITTTVGTNMENIAAIIKENRTVSQIPSKSPGVSVKSKSSIDVKKLHPGEVVAVTTEEDYVDLTAAWPGLTVADFYTTWCGPCRKLAPELEKMALQYRDVRFIKVNAEELEPLAYREGVKAFPTVVYYKNGQKISTTVGANVKKITAIIKEHSQISGGIREHRAGSQRSSKSSLHSLGRHKQI